MPSPRPRNIFSTSLPPIGLQLGYLSAETCPSSETAAPDGSERQCTRRRPLRALERKAPMPESEITGRLARYMAKAREQQLARHVAREAQHRILDTLAAMVSGSRLKPGEMAIRYAKAQGGVAEASVLATDIRTTAGKPP